MCANCAEFTREEKRHASRDGEIAVWQRMSMRKRIVTRFHTEAIARKKQNAITPIQEREGEHAAKVVERCRHAPRRNRSKHGFGV